jgi:hypothetical protein
MMMKILKAKRFCSIELVTRRPDGEGNACMGCVCGFNAYSYTQMLNHIFAGGAKFTPENWTQRSESRELQEHWIALRMRDFNENL